jgi:hypothetical protein
MTKCYQCKRDAFPLSHRSRCAICEANRADLNECENEDLREEMAEQAERDDMVETDDD